MDSFERMLCKGFVKAIASYANDRFLNLTYYKFGDFRMTSCKGVMSGVFNLIGCTGNADIFIGVIGEDGEPRFYPVEMFDGGVYSLFLAICKK